MSPRLLLLLLLSIVGLPFASHACEPNLSYLESRLIRYDDPQLVEMRESILSTDIQAALNQAGREGLDPKAAAAAAKNQAEEAVRAISQARQSGIQIAADEALAKRAFDAVDEGRPLPSELLPLGRSMLAGYIRTYIAATWNKIANEETARQFECIAGGGSPRKPTMISLRSGKSLVEEAKQEVLASRAAMMEGENKEMAALVRTGLAALAAAPGFLPPSAEQRRSYNQLLLSLEEMHSAKDLDAWEQLSGNLGDAAFEHVRKYPDDVRVWAIVALDSLARLPYVSSDRGILAARALERMGAVNLDDPVIGRLVARLDRKNWFKEKTRAEIRASTADKWAKAELAPAPTGVEWVNSLNMGFVRVGRIYFSVYETRIEDYLAFVRDHKDDPQSKIRRWLPQSWQEPRHPAVRITWEEAKQFCGWLTQRERKMGLLKNEQFYRLPTDREWSLAAGLPEEKGAFPEERSDANLYGEIPIYYWGQEWPQPNANGNYPEISEYYRAARIRRGANITVGEWFETAVFSRAPSDGFTRTAPVGSFSANKAGLFDLGGNVREWCEEYSGKNVDSLKQRTIRDLSWKPFLSRDPTKPRNWVYSVQDLDYLATKRTSFPESMSDDDLGFRVVLVVQDQ